MKICTKCKLEKDEKEFSSHFDKKHKKIIIYSSCKNCKKIYNQSEKRKSNYKIYLELNKEKIRTQQYKWRNDKYKEDEEYRNKILQKRKEYVAKNKKEVSKKKYESKKKRLKDDSLFKMVERIRCRIYVALRKGYTKKMAKSFDYIGCSYEELRIHLESQFQEGMSWENYGEWEIDHIFPISRADLNLESERYKVFHYTNLQPLWKEDNRIKGNKI